MENVNERLRKTVQILENANVPYAVVGGHAVRAWVAQIDEAAVRTTCDVDVLVRPADLPRLRAAMESAGYHFRRTSGVAMFVDQPDASARDAIHVVLVGEMIRPNDFEPNPDIEPCETTKGFRTITLQSLVRMKLNSYRRKDQVHLLDMISVGLIDETWPTRFPAELATRLQQLLDDPDG